MHNTLAKEVQACAREAGLYTSENRVVPAWIRCKSDGTREDAELDFITWSRDPNYIDYVDVTIRHSLTKGTLRRAANEYDTVTTKAEGEKHKRYPQRDGLKVTPFAMETYGRIGPAGSRYLKKLAIAAEATDEDMGWAPHSRLQGWLQRLFRAHFRAVVRTIQEASGVFSRPRASNTTDPPTAEGTLGEPAEGRAKQHERVLRALTSDAGSR